MTSPETKNRPSIPVEAAGIFVIKRSQDGKIRILLAKRLGDLEKNRLSSPGGKRKKSKQTGEYDETPEACAARELFEETGIRVKKESLVRLYEGTQEFTISEQAYYYHAFLLIWDEKMGFPENKEKDQHGEWEWWEIPVVKWLNLRDRLSQAATIFLEEFERYQNHYDAAMEIEFEENQFEPQIRNDSVARLLDNKENCPEKKHSIC
jgi:ADP-ribose pyrophosphatase YjhB (NUDIX family)